MADRIWKWKIFCLPDLVCCENLLAPAGCEDDLHHLGLAVEEGSLAWGPPNIVLRAGGLKEFVFEGGEFWKKGHRFFGSF